MTSLLILAIEQKKKDLLQEKKSDEFDVLLHGSTGHLEVRTPVLVHAYEMLIVNPGDTPIARPPRISEDRA